MPEIKIVMKIKSELLRCCKNDGCENLMNKHDDRWLYNPLVYANRDEIYNLRSICCKVEVQNLTLKIFFFIIT